MDEKNLTDIPNKLEKQSTYRQKPVIHAISFLLNKG